MALDEEGAKQAFLEVWNTQHFIVTIDQLDDGRWISLLEFMTGACFAVGLFDEAEEAKQAGIEKARYIVDYVGTRL